jgi:hypothetical protein
MAPRVDVVTARLCLFRHPHAGRDCDRQLQTYRIACGQQALAMRTHMLLLDRCLCGAGYIYSLESFIKALGNCLGAILSWWQDLPERARITGKAKKVAEASACGPYLGVEQKAAPRTRQDRLGLSPKCSVKGIAWAPPLNFLFVTAGLHGFESFEVPSEEIVPALQLF